MVPILFFDSAAPTIAEDIPTLTPAHPTANQVTLAFVDAYLANGAPASLASPDSQSTFDETASSDAVGDDDSDSDDSDLHVRAGGTIAHFSPRVIPRHVPQAEDYQDLLNVADVLETEDVLGSDDPDFDSDGSDIQVRQTRTVHYWATRTADEVDRDVHLMRELVLRPPDKRRFPVLPPTGSLLRMQKRGVRRWLRQYPHQLLTPPPSPSRPSSFAPSQLTNHGDVIEHIVRMAARRVFASQHDWDQQQGLRQRIARHFQL